MATNIGGVKFGLIELAFPLDAGSIVGTGVLSQYVVETVTLNTSAGRYSQYILELTATQTSSGRYSQFIVETATTRTSAGRVSQFVVEVLSQIIVVDKTASTTWNVVGVVDKTANTTWNLGGPIDVTRSTTWNVQSLLPLTDHISLWLMADIGLTLDDLNDVVIWADHSKYNLTVEQTSTFSRPAKINNSLNNLPVVEFNGLTNFMSISNPTTGVGALVYPDWTFVMVIRDNRTDTVARDILSNASTLDVLTANFVGTVALNPTRVRFTEYVGGSQDGNLGRGDLNDQSSAFILTVMFGTRTGEGGTDTRIFQNDDLIYSATTNLGARSWFVPYFLGRRGGFSQNYFHGDLAEIIVYEDQAIADSDFQQVLSYLKKKWFGTTVVSKTRDTTWNVVEATHVDKTASTTWNVAPDIVDKTASTTWNVAPVPTTTASKTGQVIWTVFQAVPAGPNTEWNVVEATHVDKTASTTWNVAERLHVNKSHDTEWDDHHLVTAGPISTTWLYLHTRTKIRSTLWDIEAFVDTTHSTIWDVDSAVLKSVSTPWDVLQTAGRIQFPQPVNRARWNVAEKTPLIANLQEYAEWNTMKAVPHSASSTWNDDVLASLTANATWNDDVSANKIPSTTWNVHRTVSISAGTNWLVFPMSAIRFGLWNVDVRVPTQRVTKWVVVSYNNNTSQLLYNIYQLANVSTDTNWNVLSPPIRLTPSTTWNVQGSGGVKIKTFWDVQRNRPRLGSTYWNVESVIISCTPVPPGTVVGSPNLKVSTRWNVDASSSSAFFWTRWNVHYTADPIGLDIIWYVHKSVSTSAQVIWRVDKFTTGTSVSTLWNNSAHIDKVISVYWYDHIPADHTTATIWQVGLDGPKRVVRWNITEPVWRKREVFWSVFLPMIGNSQRSTTWDDLQTASLSSSTTWDVSQHASKSVSTTWAIAVFATVGTTWDVHTTVDKNVNNSTWNVQHVVEINVSTAWTTIATAGASRESSWDYSVVITSVNTTWRAYSTVNHSEGMATLWNIEPQCTATLIASDPCVNSKSGCSTGLLSKITICQLDRLKQQKKYQSRFVKG